jgi:hypothetical protein
MTTSKAEWALPLVPASAVLLAAGAAEIAAANA